MPYLLGRLKVEDYTKFKSVFVERAPLRQALGSKGGKLLRNANDPNEVFVILQWDTLEHAQQFTQSTTLREGMKLAGVADRPDFYFLDEAEDIPG